MLQQNPPEHFSIDELSTLAGVTPRTVRYYIAEGLVDRPEGKKRGSHYLRRHLEQLLVIRRWTDAGLTPEQVRGLVRGITNLYRQVRTEEGGAISGNAAGISLTTWENNDV